MTNEIVKGFKDFSGEETEFIKPALAIKNTGFPIFYHSEQQPTDIFEDYWDAGRRAFDERNYVDARDQHENNSHAFDQRRIEESEACIIGRETAEAHR